MGTIWNSAAESLAGWLASRDPADRGRACCISGEYAAKTASRPAGDIESEVTGWGKGIASSWSTVDILISGF